MQFSTLHRGGRKQGLVTGAAQRDVHPAMLGPHKTFCGGYHVGQTHSRNMGGAATGSAAALPGGAVGAGGNRAGEGGTSPAVVAAAGLVGAGGVAATPRDMSLEPFKALVESRRFHCTMCGKCCTGEGEIWVSPDEAGRIAAHLNLSLPRFQDLYTKQYSKYNGWKMLKTAGDEVSSCIFLGTDNKCSIHTVRPSQCSTYPWWPELTVDQEWEWEKANVCEGFDHAEAGPLDVEEAARQLREANKMTQVRLLASTVRISRQVATWAENVLVWDKDGEGKEEGAPQAGRQDSAGGQGQGRSDGGAKGQAGRGAGKGGSPSKKR